MMFGSAPGVSELESGDGPVDESRTEAESGIVSELRSACLEEGEDVVEVGV
jgi:hypothetical protein